MVVVASGAPGGGVPSSARAGLAATIRAASREIGDNNFKDSEILESIVLTSWERTPRSKQIPSIGGRRIDPSQCALRSNASTVGPLHHLNDNLQERIEETT